MSDAGLSDGPPISARCPEDAAARDVWSIPRPNVDIPAARIKARTLEKLSTQAMELGIGLAFAPGNDELVGLLLHVHAELARVARERRRADVSNALRKFIPGGGRP